MTQVWRIDLQREKKKEVFVIVERKLAGRGLARLGNILMSRS